MPKKVRPSSSVSSTRQDTGLPVARRAVLKAGLGLASVGSPVGLWSALARAASPVPLTAGDFRYSPDWWQTAICLPDDPDKALVGREGQLLLDWAVRLSDKGEPIDVFTADPASFGVVLQPDVVDGAHWVRQSMPSARVPVIQTVRSTGSVEISEQTFVASPTADYRVQSSPLSRVDYQGFMMYGWAKPERDRARAFADCALAIGGPGFDMPIRFQLSVAPGSTVSVVYGLCEGRYTKPGERLLILSAEGSGNRTVDPVQDFGANRAGIYKLLARDVNRDGIIDISVSAPPQSHDHQTVLNALWVFSGSIPDDEDITAGRSDHLAIARFPEIVQPPRRAIILMSLRNSGGAVTTQQPVLRIRSMSPVTEAEHAVYVASGTRISGSSALTLMPAEIEGEFIAKLPEVILQPGESHEVVFTVDRHAPAGAYSPDASEARRLLHSTQTWWEKYELPYDIITVPDRNIQDVLDASIRNIWQARELKNGQPAFQVGPTCYRGLWVTDGSFLLESAAMLGRIADARNGIEYLLSGQKADGSFEGLARYWKENGIVLWAVTRHASLTQDKSWLRLHWSALERVVTAIRRMRDAASKDPQALNYRLMPGGYVDGGVDNLEKVAPEYSTVYWTLTGLKSFITAARWLGEDVLATSCAKEYEELYEAFRRACNRDLLKDRQGNPYLPIMMGNAEKYTPQRGQYSFCQAVYPGQVFPKGDPFVEGQLSMLRAARREGIVCDTGWIRGGLWTYFASFYGHAQLWHGHGREAAESLYAFVQHACPTRVWREEQRLRGDERRKGDLDGDMPHNWASAELIRLVAHLIEIDRGEELHLLEGFPREWARRGMVTKLNGLLTPFGPLYLEVRVEDSGRRAQVRLKRLAGRVPKKIVLHLEGLTGHAEVLELAADRDVTKAIDLSTAPRNDGERRS